MARYKIIKVERWNGTDVTSYNVDAADLDDATVKMAEIEMGDDGDEFNSVKDVSDAIWGGFIPFDSGESRGIEMDEGTEIFITLN